MVPMALRAQLALASGAEDEALRHYLDLVEILRDQSPAMAAIELGTAAFAVGWSDPKSAATYAAKGSHWQGRAVCPTRSSTTSRHSRCAQHR